jgi:hypothetical protein
MPWLKNVLDVTQRIVAGFRAYQKSGEMILVHFTQMVIQSHKEVEIIL